MKQPGSLGGRDDVSLPGDLPELGRWKPADVGYLEADELGAADEFPTRGVFLLVELLEDGSERYVGITEGLDRMLVEAIDEEDVGLQELTVEVDTAEKAGDEETAPWRYSASIVPAERVGPPDEE